MTSIALIFPGQGAQKIGMGLEFFQNSPQARSIFEQADSICANGLSEVMFKGPDDKLTSTAYCQPAIFAASMAALKAFEAHPKYRDFSVKFTAGLSLGEYSALTAAGVMDFADTLRLVQKRAAFMEAAANESEGAMAAVIGFDKSQLTEICRRTGAQIANYNSHEQIVITGLREKVHAAVEAIKAAGGQKVIPLAVSGAFHSSLMMPAASKFAETLKEVKINPPVIPVLSNVDAQPHAQAPHIRENLARQITESVQWVKCVEYMASQGVKNFIEIGPGKVLKGLIRRIDSSLNVSNIEKPLDIETLAFS
jgi:[acyl-carrier-protein] S-malonyltransferase